MRRNLLLPLILSIMLTLSLLPAAFAEAPSTTPIPEPLTQETSCNWELSIKDSQEYLYTENDETLKKIITIDLFATKKKGTDFFGKYNGEATITVFNALGSGEDAYPVLFGGQAASTKKLDFTFIIQPIGEILLPTWEFSLMPQRHYDGYSTLMYQIKPDKVRGIFKDALELTGLAAKPGIEFEIGDELGLLYVDGGYVLLSMTNHWQVPAPFVGTLIGVPEGGRTTQTKKTAPPAGGSSFNYTEITKTEPPQDGGGRKKATDPPISDKLPDLGLIVSRPPFLFPTATPTEGPPR